MNWKPVRKVVAAFLSGLTTTGVVAFLAEVGVTLPPGVASLIVTGAAAVAGYLVPERRTLP